MPGHGHEKPGHCRTLLLRGIGRWICSAWPAQSHCLRTHRRPGSGARQGVNVRDFFLALSTLRSARSDLSFPAGICRALRRLPGRISHPLEQRASFRTPHTIYDEMFLTKSTFSEASTTAAKGAKQFQSASLLHVARFALLRLIKTHKFKKFHTPLDIQSYYQYTISQL